MRDTTVRHPEIVLKNKRRFILQGGVLLGEIVETGATPSFHFLPNVRSMMSFTDEIYIQQEMKKLNPTTKEAQL